MPQRVGRLCDQQRIIFGRKVFARHDHDGRFGTRYQHPDSRPSVAGRDAATGRTEDDAHGGKVVRLADSTSRHIVGWAVFGHVYPLGNNPTRCPTA